MRTTRFTTATVAMVALLTSLFAVPAAAQPAPEGFDDLQDCADAISFFLEADIDEEDRATTFVALNGTTLTVSQLLADLEDVSGLVEGDELADWIIVNCDIYTIEILPETLELTPPVAACITDEIPGLVFTTTVESGEVDVFFVDLSGTPDDNAPVVDDDPDFPDGEFTGVDPDDNEVSGIIRARYTVDLEEDGTDGSYELLWPGMELNSDGEPVKWPGWEPVGPLENPDTWERVDDDGFAWARATVASQDLGVFFRFNPETTVFYVGYPPPDTGCADPDIPEEPEGEEPEVAGITLTRPAEVLGTRLPVTGADAAILALFGAVLLGLGVLAVRRTRPKGSGLQ